MFMEFMGLIGLMKKQYGPYWSVIWPILVSNMTHITLLFGCYAGLGNKKPFPRMGKVMVRFASADDAAITVLPLPVGALNMSVCLLPLSRSRSVVMSTSLRTAFC